LQHKSLMHILHNKTPKYNLVEHKTEQWDGTIYTPEKHRNNVSQPVALLPLGIRDRILAGGGVLEHT
jgi:hypothetical protein